MGTQTFDSLQKEENQLTKTKQEDFFPDQSSYFDTEGDESRNMLSPRNSGFRKPRPGKIAYDKLKSSDFDPSSEQHFPNFFGKKKPANFIPQTEMHQERMRDFSKDTNF